MTDALFQVADHNPYHLRLLSGHGSAVRALAARGRTLVSGSYDHTVRVWDIITGVCRWVLSGHTQKGERAFQFFFSLSDFLQSIALCLTTLATKPAPARWILQFGSGILEPVNVYTS